MDSDLVRQIANYYNSADKIRGLLYPLGFPLAYLPYQGTALEVWLTVSSHIKKGGFGPSEADLLAAIARDLKQSRDLWLAIDAARR
jgi:hypothetical protein